MYRTGGKWFVFELEESQSDAVYSGIIVVHHFYTLCLFPVFLWSVSKSFISVLETSTKTTVIALE